MDNKIRSAVMIVVGMMSVTGHADTLHSGEESDAARASMGEIDDYDSVDDEIEPDPDVIVTIDELVMEAGPLPPGADDIIVETGVFSYRVTPMKPDVAGQHRLTGRFLAVWDANGFTLMNQHGSYALLRINVIAGCHYTVSAPAETTVEDGARVVLRDQYGNRHSLFVNMLWTLSLSFEADETETRSFYLEMDNFWNDEYYAEVSSAYPDGFTGYARVPYIDVEQDCTGAVIE